MLGQSAVRLFAPPVSEREPVRIRMWRVPDVLHVPQPVRHTELSEGLRSRSSPCFKLSAGGGRPGKPVSLDPGAFFGQKTSRAMQGARE